MSIKIHKLLGKKQYLPLIFVGLLLVGVFVWGQLVGEPEAKKDFSYPEGSIQVPASPLITEEICNQIEGWHWSPVIGECVSFDLGNSPLSWEVSEKPDASHMGVYSCVSGTLQEKMAAAVKGEWFKIVNGETSAVSIADCLDGNRDLPLAVNSDQWLKENWVRKSGSHLPSRAEYVRLCSQPEDFEFKRKWASNADYWLAEIWSQTNVGYVMNCQPGKKISPAIVSFKANLSLSALNSNGIGGSGLRVIIRP